MKKKMTTTLAMFLVLFCLLCSPIGVIAASNNTSPRTSLPTIGVQSSNPGHGSGLYNFSGSVSSFKQAGVMTPDNLPASDLLASAVFDIFDEGNAVEVRGATFANGDLNEVGIKNLCLQRWDGSQWVNVYNRSGHDSNTESYFYDSTTAVTPGFYYRAIGTHYAIKYVLFLPYEQDLYNETSYIYIG